MVRIEAVDSVRGMAAANRVSRLKRMAMWLKPDPANALQPGHRREILPATAAHNIVLAEGIANKGVNDSNSR